MIERQPLPTGVVTFLFTDIQGSTALWESRPDLMASALRLHNEALRRAIQDNGGVVFKVIGDAFQAAFPLASQALKAAIEAQRSLASAPWKELGPLKVRMGLHSGEAELDPDSDEYLVSHTKNRVARIMSAGHGGQILISSAVVELLGGRLPLGVSLKDLGEHHLRGLLQPERIYQVNVPGLPVEFPPLKTEDPQSKLPLPITPFLDREKELEHIFQLLQNPQCRLMTLTGIGGSGKTRLAIEAAHQAQSLFPQVFFIGLASVNAIEDLILAIAEVTEYAFRAPPGNQLPVEEAKAQLLDFLADKNALLVLDNFEQLSCCAGLLNELLSAAPAVKLLVTSRERLNLPGEWVREIAGLPYPPRRDDDAITQFAAVRLFVNSADRASRFNADQDDWRAIARICQLLEGIPLGIEMAAAWIKVFSCREILAEIERNIDFLSATWREAPERHQTLRAVFETSWRLLAPQERDVFCRLAVFQGGFRHEAAQQIAGATLSTLAGLMDKSLIRRVASGRFEIHPVLQPYALEKLSAEPLALAEVRTRHALYFSDLMEQMFAKLKGSDQLTALAVLRAEVQNLRLASRELLAQRDFRRLRALLPAVILFFEMNNQRVETHEVVKLLADLEPLARQELGRLSAPESVDDRNFMQSLLALNLAALHHFSLYERDPQEIAAYQDESLQLLEGLPDTEAKAYAILLDCRGPSSLSLDQRLDLLQQSYGILKRIDDAWGAALVQLIWADVVNFSEIDLDLPCPAYQASLQTFEQAGNLWGQALCLNGLAIIEHKSGNYAEAYRLGRKVQDLFSQLGNEERVADVRHALGEAALKLGNLPDARRHFEANVAYFAQQGDKARQRYYQERLTRLE